jgi:hypothetical protein
MVTIWFHSLCYYVPSSPQHPPLFKMLRRSQELTGIPVGIVLRKKSNVCIVNIHYFIIKDDLLSMPFKVHLNHIRAKTYGMTCRAWKMQQWEDNLTNAHRYMIRYVLEFLWLREKPISVQLFWYTLPVKRLNTPTYFMVFLYFYYFLQK